MDNQEEQPLPLEDFTHIEAVKQANNLINRFHGHNNPYYQTGAGKPPCFNRGM